VSLKRAYIDLHIAVVLLAGTAILGDLISLSASALVWWRTLIASLGIGLFLLVSGRLNMGWIRNQRKLYLLGGMVAIHWICFFGSIKLANASTALICFATISLFTAVIEPWITGRKRETHEIVFGLMVIPGIVLIAGRAQGDVLMGIVLGITAALLLAIFSSYEKKWIQEVDPEHMTMMQMTGAWLTMCVWIIGEKLLFGLDQFVPSGQDFIYLLILGLVCTCVAWVLCTRAVRSVTAFDSIMVINLEPVYGIIMAFLILKDFKELNTNFYVGAGIILASVIIHPIWQSRYARN
jgi:drug/metabolite transporter (DMT)-like permease